MRAGVGQQGPRYKADQDTTANDNVEQLPMLAAA